MGIEQLRGKYERLRGELTAAYALLDGRRQRSGHLDRLANELHITEQMLWRQMPDDEQAQDSMLGFTGDSDYMSRLPTG